MNPAQLLSHFDRISDAPDAIPRLRRFILDLAVRGKLVEQDPRDEPALELLGRIETEKLKLIKEGKLKRQEPLSPVNEDELPFPVPHGWQPARLAVVAGCLDYMREPINSTERDQRIAGKNPSELFPYFGATQQQGWIDDYIFDEELVLLGEDGVPFFDDLRSKAYLISGKTWVNNHAHVFRGILVSPAFLVHYLNTFDYKGRVAGATRSKLNQAKAVDIPIILPPLAEQHRIVAKVDELMALCDRLEAAQTDRESRRDRLAAASLQMLNNGADPDAFRNHARFYFNHLPRLTTRLEHIQQLRQTILNLAVRGKLVPQDPNDEPAEELAEPPAKKSAPQKGDRDAPFELPATWQWMQLGQVSELINGDRSKNYPNKAEYVREGVAWINTGHIEPDGTLSTDSMHYITRKKFDSLRSGKVRPGDLIYCLRGATLGKTAIITQFDEGAVASSLVIVRLSPAVDPRFAYQVLTSPLGREQIFQFDNGSAQPNLSANNVKKYWIPLPPLAEQQRIIAKVEELMALCDRLEAQLTTTRTESRRLLEAVLHEALAQAV